MFTRRQAIAALAGAGLALAVPRRARAANASPRLRLAFVAVGGRGRSNVLNSIAWIGGWRDGALVKPDAVSRLPAELVAKTDNAIAFVGTEATLFIPDMRASARPRIFPVEREREFLAALPPRRLPRPTGGHHQDWIDAVLQERPAGAPFSYGAPLTEKVLLGTLAHRTGKPVRWQADDLRVVDNPAAAAPVRPPS